MQLKGFSLEWVFKCVLRLPDVVQESYIGCRRKAFFLNGLTRVSWGDQLVCWSSYTVCSWMTSLLRGLTCASWGHQLVCRSSYTVCNWKASLHCEPACGSSHLKLWCLSIRTGCNCEASFHHAEAILDLYSSWRRDHSECTSWSCLQSRFPWIFVLANFGSSTLDQSCGVTEEDIRSSFKVFFFMRKVKVIYFNWKRIHISSPSYHPTDDHHHYMIFILMMKSFSLSGGEALLDRDDQSPFWYHSPF